MDGILLTYYNFNVDFVYRTNFGNYWNANVLQDENSKCKFIGKIK